MQAKQPVNMSLLSITLPLEGKSHLAWHLANQVQIAGAADRAIPGNCAEEAQHFCTAKPAQEAPIQLSSIRLTQTCSVEGNLGKYVSMGIKASVRI